MAILGIFASVRETFLGFLLYMAFLRSQETNTKKLHIPLLMQIYVREILHLEDEYTDKIVKIIGHVADTFQEIITQWI
jgi:hypothetical protein